MIRKISSSTKTSPRLFTKGVKIIRLIRNVCCFTLCLWVSVVPSLLTTVASASSKMKEVAEEKVPIHITSERMISHNDRNMVSFLDNVVATKGKLTIYSDKMDIYTDEGQKELSKIIAMGNVKIIKEDMVATCSKAIYEEEGEKLTLRGNPAVVTENDNVIEGSEIIYFVEEENIIVHGDDKKKIEVILFTSGMEEKYGKKKKQKEEAKKQKAEEKEQTTDDRRQTTE